MRLQLKTATILSCISLLVSPAIGEGIEPLGGNLVADSFQQDPRMSGGSLTSRYNADYVFEGVQLIGEAAEPLDYGNLVLGPLPSGYDPDDNLEICSRLKSRDSNFLGYINFSAVPPVTRRTRFPDLTSDDQVKLLESSYNSQNVVMRSILVKSCRRQTHGVMVATGVTKNPTRLLITLGVDRLRSDLKITNVETGAPVLSTCEANLEIDKLICIAKLADAPPGDYEITAVIEDVAGNQDEIVRKVLVRL